MRKGGERKEGEKGSGQGDGYREEEEEENTKWEEGLLEGKGFRGRVRGEKNVMEGGT